MAALFRSRALAAVLAASLVLPAAAAASRTQESIIEDEYALLQSPAQRAKTLDDMRDLGADTLRHVVYWRSIAPSPDAKKKPSINTAHPAAYPPENWDALDDIVRGASSRGIKVLLVPSSPIPVWASQCARGGASQKRTCKPNPALFGSFVTALGRRYSGAYPDENEGGGILPRVDRWAMWNEPNQPGWLSPQYEISRGKTYVSAAVRYRLLAAAGFEALRGSGHGGDELLLGETAPIGRENGPLPRRPAPPADFIRDLLCMDRRGKRLTGSAAKLRRCGNFKRFRISGYAHHPYTRGGSQPPRSKAQRNEITVAVASRLKTLLKRGAALGRVPKNLPIWYTEFGYQTNPPDTLFGVTLEDQAAYINEADWIAYNDPRIRSVAQYKLIDEANVSNFQTGVRFLSGRAKPAFDAYRLPVWVVRRGSKVRVWGQIRPAPEGSVEEVEIQNQPAGGGDFETVATIPVDTLRGHFLTGLDGREGRWRLKWSPRDGGAPVFSREAAVASR